MNYEKYEDQIVERLKMQGVDVGVLPHVGILNEGRATAKPQLYVIINGSNFGTPENLGVIAQLETVEGEIFIRAKNRRGKMGVFELYDKISELLLGHKLQGVKSKITFNQFGYVAGIQNNWQYALTFSFDTYKVEADKPSTVESIKNISTNLDTK